MSRAIIWFRNDLRLADNPALIAALAAHDEVLPVYVLDPRQHGPSPFGFERSGPHRRKFLHEGLADLDEQLLAKGSALHAFAGQPADVLRRVARMWDASFVYTQGLNAREEVLQELEVSRELPLLLHGASTMLLPGDLPFGLRELPEVFTDFRKAVEKGSPVRETLPEPVSIPTPREWRTRPLTVEELPIGKPRIDRRVVLDFQGGRAAALARLRHYLWDTRAIAFYKETRNGLIGADYSSKLSPWLASGALSPREVFHEVKRFESIHGGNESTYWMIFELLWRDYFQFIAAKHKSALFAAGGIRGSALRGKKEVELFERWINGRTGQPFIDANMRELAGTGWMSNRGRQCVASFLAHDLGLDWRMGAWWFERKLIDYDPCSNWGNWQYVAGVGNDPRQGRRFDPERQANTYDSDGAFTRLWNAD